MTPLLRCRNLTKSFGRNIALRNVDFDLRPGEVHALAGENGAGKSTLMHLLAGVHQPDSGTIEMGGKTVSIAHERQAQDLGLAIVYQERSLFNLRTVAENLFVNHCPVNRFGLIDRKAMNAKARELLAQLNLAIEPSAVLGSLAPAQQQMVEIAKALSLSPRIFILDEPTAALTIPETRTLFAIVNRLRAQGAGIVYISHRLEEIFELGGRVSVLKDGVMQGTWNLEETSPDFLVSKMVGREKLDAHRPADAQDAGAAVRLEVRGLSCAKLRGVSFEVRANEVVGLSGLAGAGRTETALAIFGARRFESGEVLIDGKAVKIRSPRDAIAQGIAYVPEDRKELGLFLKMTVAENIAAAHLELFGQWQFSNAAMDRAAGESMQRFHVAARGPGSIAGTLSGGNQQKVLLARWLLRQPKVLIADEPTRGVDVGAKAEIYRILREIANRGAAVLVISSDLPEILAVSDRILVMRQGQVVATLDGRTADEEQVLRAAAMPERTAPAA